MIKYSNANNEEIKDGKIIVKKKYTSDGKIASDVEKTDEFDSAQRKTQE